MKCLNRTTVTMCVSHRVKEKNKISVEETKSLFWLVGFLLCSLEECVSWGGGLGCSRPNVCWSVMVRLMFICGRLLF